MNSEITRRLKGKAKTEKEKETVKPTVINDVLIGQYIIEYNRENEIYDKQEEPLWELEHLSLSYKNIIEIDNLTGLEKLQKLQLDNNIICKIQNMDHLVNLKWLDLSFNLITQIENLSKLTQLTDLSLFANQIKKLEGLDTLTELNVLSFGQNLFTAHDEPVQYLKKLKNKLEVLKMADNPFSFTSQNEADYKLYTIEMLKSLKYLDYELIDDQMKKAAELKYGEANNDAEAAAGGEEEVEKEVDHELVEARIDCTDRMLDNILNSFEDHKKLRVLQGFENEWQKYDEQVNDQTQKFQTEMKNLYRQKKHLIEYCSKAMRDSELDCEQRAINFINDFQGIRKHKFRDIEDEEGRELQYDDFEKELIGLVDELEDNLMEIEMKLQDALTNAVNIFKEKMQGFNNDMKQRTITYIKFVGEESEGFNDRLREAALKDQDAFAQRLEEQGEEMLQEENTTEEQDIYLDLMVDREMLVQVLDNSKEFIENQVNAKEGQINKAIEKDKKNTEDGITDAQHKRNRGIVQEIILTCGCFRKEIGDEIDVIKGPDDY